MRPDRTFRSKVDVWLVVLLGVSAALPLLAAGWLVWRGEFRGVLLLGLWGAVMLLAVGVLTVPLRYVFRADRLHIQSGWLEWDVPYAGLRKAAPSLNPLSAPAWSIHRVKLESAGGSFILVSPDDRKSFMDELAARCPHLVRTADGLAARPPSP
ncbi:MAG: hypothetical protein C0502_00850 [Opitutus sp.]|nr:hypothetical protein [Opitutus sp.]